MDTGGGRARSQGLLKKEVILLGTPFAQQVWDAWVVETPEEEDVSEQGEPGKSWNWGASWDRAGGRTALGTRWGWWWPAEKALLGGHSGQAASRLLACEGFP